MKTAAHWSESWCWCQLHAADTCSKTRRVPFLCINTQTSVPKEEHLCTLSTWVTGWRHVINWRRYDKTQTRATSVCGLESESRMKQDCVFCLMSWRSWCVAALRWCALWPIHNNQFMLPHPSNLKNQRFRVLSAMKSIVFCDVMPCGLVCLYWYFRGDILLPSLGLKSIMSNQIIGEAQISNCKSSQLVSLDFSCASAGRTYLGPGPSKHVSCDFHSFKPRSKIWTGSDTDDGEATIRCVSILGSCRVSLSGRCGLHWWHKTNVGLFSDYWVSLSRVGKPPDVLL
jgi:hypothetical protein